MDINAELTAKVAAMSEAQRSAHLHEIVKTFGEMDDATCLEFTKLLFGPKVTVTHAA